jgi:hypothetical protein
MRGVDVWILAMFFTIIFFSHILPSPKDTHKEVFGSHSDIVIYPLDNQINSSQVPMDAVFYMPLIL